MAKHNQAKFRALANMGDILIKMNNLEEAVKVCTSYYTESHTPQRQTVRYAILREVRQRRTHTPQRQTVRYVLPSEVRQRRTTRDLVRRSIRQCSM